MDIVCNENHGQFGIFDDKIMSILESYSKLLTCLCGNIVKKLFIFYNHNRYAK